MMRIGTIEDHFMISQCICKIAGPHDPVSCHYGFTEKRYKSLVWNLLLKRKLAEYCLNI